MHPGGGWGAAPPRHAIESAPRHRGLLRIKAGPSQCPDFAIQPGGPNIDGVAIVASGRFEIGQVSSSPSLMLAASQGIPVKSFAVSVQEHPYAFFSLGSKPIRTPKDMIGKKIGIQATGKVLLSALLKKHDIPESDVEVGSFDRTALSSVS